MRYAETAGLKYTMATCFPYAEDFEELVAELKSLEEQIAGKAGEGRRQRAGSPTAYPV